MIMDYLPLIFATVVMLAILAFAAEASSQWFRLGWRTRRLDCGAHTRLTLRRQTLLPDKTTVTGCTTVQSSAVRQIFAYECRHDIRDGARAYSGLFEAQLLLGVGESRFEHFANRLPSAAVELN
jgi:hypothetical protein